MIAQLFKVSLLALSLVASPVFAREDDAELERKLDDAKERLEEASREVAELSAQLGEGAIDFVRHFEMGARRAMIGINMDDPHGKEDGVLVSGVTPGGPAEQAGLRSGDVIVSINGTALTRDDQGSPQRKILDAMRDVKPGDEVSLEYERDGKKSTATVVTEEMDPGDFAFAFGDGMKHMLPNLENLPNLHDFTSRWGDMEMVTLTGELGDYFGTDKGILVVRAPHDPDIPLKDGDVIQRIDGRTPTSPGHALRILRSYQGGEHLNVEIVRKQRPMTLDIELKEREGDKLRESMAPGEPFFDIPVPGPSVET
jgi:C-terminal processing protease CtpA/Prc